MDQIKIGKFISTKRKEKNITQSELAEKLNITDRAISKWENGICLPDANNMPDLCKILAISINDLFSGEIVDMKENEKKDCNFIQFIINYIGARFCVLLRLRGRAGNGSYHCIRQQI